MIKIGITGGIGSGKSVICKIFNSLGIPVYYSDLRAKELLNSSQEIKTALTDIFGNDLYTKDGIDKTKLANIIFNDKSSLEKVNKIVHPIVMNDYFLWCEKQHSEISINESAIIFEANLKDNFDYIITVTAPKEKRIERVIKRDNTRREEVISRINHQYPDELKAKESDSVIINDGITPLLTQIKAILNTLK